MTRIDLNADIGESFGRYQLPGEEELLALVTSANIACGFHAGDPLVMQRVVGAAAGRQVTIGAHPGYRDLVGFGRRELAASATELAAESVATAFTDLQLPELVCFTLTTNRASQRVMRKVGFRFEREFIWKSQPHLLHRLISADWSQSA